jgi:hypothetical protein
MSDYDTDEEYQKSILEFFNLTEYENDIIMDKIGILYSKVKDIPLFQDKMREGAKTVMSEDLEIGLVILFSYENFKEFRKILENYKIKLSD